MPCQGPPEGRVCPWAGMHKLMAELDAWAQAANRLRAQHGFYELVTTEADSRAPGGPVLVLGRRHGEDEIVHVAELDPTALPDELLFYPVLLGELRERWPHAGFPGWEGVYE